MLTAGLLEVRSETVCSETREWKRLHNEELYELYSSPYYSGDEIEKNEMGGACSMYGQETRCVQGFGGVTCGKETTWEV